jgi:hypothetical protein
VRELSDDDSMGKGIGGVAIASFTTMSLGGPDFTPAHQPGILHLLDAYDVDPTGLHAVIEDELGPDSSAVGGHDVKVGAAAPVDEVGVRPPPATAHRPADAR